MLPSRAMRNIQWIEGNCLIPQGPDVGKPVRLRAWQRAIIHQIYDNPDRTRMAIVSVRRKIQNRR